jgi:hypothetical protein
LNFRRPKRWLIGFAGAVGLAGWGPGCGSSSESGNPEPLEGGAILDAPVGDAPQGPWDAHTDANACQPGNVADFKPVWKSPTPFHQGVCTKDQWTTFYSACLSTSGSPTACAEFTNQTSKQYKCGQCLAAAEGAEHYGPLIVHKGWGELNIAGCVANAMNDPTGVKCAASVQALDECELAACAVNCPVTNQSSFDALGSCKDVADTSVCRSYIDGEGCLAKLSDAGQTELGICVDGKAFAQHFEELAELFCGGVPLDAGADGG